MSGWTEQDIVERGKRLLSEQERVRAAKGFVGALSEMVEKPMAKLDRDAHYRTIPEYSAAGNSQANSRALKDLMKIERASRKPRVHPERDLEKACSDLLQLDGWRMLKTDPGSDASVIGAIRRAILACPALNHVRELIFSILKRCQRGKGFGEVGMADCLYIRYSGYEHHHAADSTSQVRHDEVLWLEWKSLTGKLSQHQRLWHAAERARGGFTQIAGQDFPATVDGFLEWYRGSGLMRRKL